MNQISINCQEAWNLKKRKQAGAELCQAQVKLPKNKFTFHLPKKLQVIFHLQKKFSLFSTFLKI